MITAVAFVVASALGALARAEAGRRWNAHDGFPTGTLVVNVTGSFLVGLVAGVAPPAITVVAAGALGAYTTFSSFARDTVALMAKDNRKALFASVYVVASCVLSIGAAAAGLALSGAP